MSQVQTQRVPLSPKQHRLMVILVALSVAASTYILAQLYYVYAHPAAAATAPLRSPPQTPLYPP